HTGATWGFLATTPSNFALGRQKAARGRVTLSDSSDTFSGMWSIRSKLRSRALFFSIWGTQSAAGGRPKPCLLARDACVPGGGDPGAAARRDGRRVVASDASGRSGRAGSPTRQGSSDY